MGLYGGSRSQIFFILHFAGGFLIYVLAPSATLDRRLKKRWSAFADDEELKNSFFGHIVEVTDCSVSLSTYQGQASPQRGGCFIASDSESKNSF